MGNEGRKELHKKICTNLLVSIGIVLLIIFAVPPLIKFFFPLIIAWIIASIANPMVRFLEDKIKIMRKHGSVIVIILVLVLVGGLLYMAVYATVVQISSLVSDLPDVYRQVMENLQDSFAQLHHRFRFIPENIQGLFEKNEDKINDIVLSFFKSLQTSPISAVGSFASSLIDFVVLSILTLMLSYFFVAQRDFVKKMFQKCTPQGVKSFWNMAMGTCFRAIAGYLKACFKIMLVIFAILLVIYGGVMRVEYAVLLALLTAVLDFLPFLGTGCVITPWAIYCMLTGEYANGVILIVTYVICLVVHRLLEPKLVGDSVGMSPFATLISMFIGYRLIGMLGLIIGIPAGMILMAFKDQGMFDSQVKGIKILAHDINEYRKY